MLSAWWQELTSGPSLLTAGASFLFVGFFLWRINSALRRTFEHRASYAENLRRAGRPTEAEAMERDTRGLARRVPLYGKVLALAGLALGLAGWLRLK